MAVSLPKQVDDVAIEYLSKKNGSDEDTLAEQLLHVFQLPDAERKRLELLSKNPDWQLNYHLSYARENLLNWYNFKKDTTLLEVRSGYGALTGIFAKNCAHVTAIDTSPTRAVVNAYRNREAKNLKLVVGALPDMPTNTRYDYITAVDAVECIREHGKHNSYAGFLGQLHRRLKPGGTLILAIENQLGIKYWSGAREDHLGQLFTNIEGYPQDTGVRTFGRNELEQLFRDAGFTKNDFYYPFPDYRMPVDIYSDEYQPGGTGALSSDLFPTPSPSQPREILFAEDLAMGSVARNGLFPYFANSFLVFAQKGKH